jgi:hypothetical protein
LPFGVGYIRFVAYNNLGDAIRLALIDLFDPIFETVKSFPVVDSVDKDNPSSSFIIGFSYGFKSLLASSVPDLHFDFDFIDGHSFNFEINPNRSNMCHLIFLIYIS